jgi:hypothetical protein
LKEPEDHFTLLTMKKRIASTCLWLAITLNPAFGQANVPWEAAQLEGTFFTLPRNTWSAARSGTPAFSVGAKRPVGPSQGDFEVLVLARELRGSAGYEWTMRCDKLSDLGTSLPNRLPTRPSGWLDAKKHDPLVFRTSKDQFAPALLLVGHYYLLRSGNILMLMSVDDIAVRDEKSGGGIFSVTYQVVTLKFKFLATTKSWEELDALLSPQAPKVLSSYSRPNPPNAPSLSSDNLEPTQPPAKSNASARPKTNPDDGDLVALGKQILLKHEALQRRVNLFLDLPAARAEIKSCDELLGEINKLEVDSGVLSVTMESVIESNKVRSSKLAEFLRNSENVQIKDRVQTLINGLTTETGVLEQSVKEWVARKKEIDRAKSSLAEYRKVLIITQGK